MGTTLKALTHTLTGTTFGTLMGTTSGILAGAILGTIMGTTFGITSHAHFKNFLMWPQIRFYFCTHGRHGMRKLISSCVSWFPPSRPGKKACMRWATSNPNTYVDKIPLPGSLTDQHCEDCKACNICIVERINICFCCFEENHPGC